MSGKRIITGKHPYARARIERVRRGLWKVAVTDAATKARIGQGTAEDEAGAKWLAKRIANKHMATVAPQFRLRRWIWEVEVWED
ncbi:MAG: hypothetical protein M0Z66_16820 [Thermaerobacter sp.]|nr:hypothetical protein [Thermaerobacter sp.]